MSGEKCPSCKYFAVPLTASEIEGGHCPGANPNGDPGRKVCVLKGRPEFEGDADKLEPENCSYYFPVFLRFR
ncbi:MAG: hypothetical protein ACTSU5_00065 [Promethearchaeota archaeon]